MPMYVCVECLEPPLAALSFQTVRWKNVWVDLREGKLSWYKEGPGGLLLGVMPMIGSAVALLPAAEVRVFPSLLLRYSLERMDKQNV